jgi:uncharacterized phage protein (TIGR02218 family)
LRTLPGGLAARLASRATLLAVCWRLERRDGLVFRATSADVDLSVEGEVYVAAAGYVPGAIEARADLSVPGLEVSGVLDSEELLAEDLAAGRWDGATWSLYLVDAEAPGDGALLLGAGELGEVTRHASGAFSAELRGVSARLQQTIGEVLTPTCRAHFGDMRCGVDLEPLTVAGTVETVDSGEPRRIFTDTARAEASGFWDYGLVTWTSGANAGAVVEVQSSTDAGVVSLFDVVPVAIAIGDGYELTPGCDKRLETCAGRYANAARFVGEPAIPGQDALMRFGGQ